MIQAAAASGRVTLVGPRYGAVSRPSTMTGLTAPSSSEGPRVDGPPFAIPTDQRYYWSKKWQEGVRMARADLDSGQYVDFDSDDPNDVVHWLYRTDE